MERDAKRFKVYNAKTGKWMMNVPEKGKSNGGAFIAADYVHVEGTQFKQVVTTSNNNSINFWEAANYIERPHLDTFEI